MKPSIETLGKILYSPSQFVIPVFQRQYRWEQPEWDKLWDSLEEIQQPNKTGNHFMGFLVVMPGLAQPGHSTRFHLIDGQQRLTTLSLLLAAIRNVARRTRQADLAKEIEDYYLVHPLKKGDDYFRILPKVRDSQDYKAVITGKGDPDGRVGHAVRYYESRLANIGASSDGALRKLFNTITERLEFMTATLEHENAYNIFKSLNSIGVPLEQSDLIRNFVFMHMPPEDHDEFDREAWAPLERRFLSDQGTLDEDRFSRFFRDFLMRDGDYVSPQLTFATFEQRYEATDFEPRELADTLDRYADYYEVISGGKHDADRGVTQALAGLNALESSTTYPLLLKLFAMRYEGQLDSAGLAKAIQMLQSFIIRRFIAGESSRSYGRLFVRACKLQSEDILQELNDFLVGRTWPDDRRFVEAFVEFPLYERGYARHILETIERSSNHKEPADLSQSQIEHIMPQTLSDAWRKSLGEDWERIQTDWLHRPGNLTLSGYNAPLSNSPFDDKRGYYEDSNITITRQLTDYSDWGEQEIRARGEALAEIAAGIWISPGPVAKTQTRSSSNDDNGENGQSGNLSHTRVLQLKYWEQFHELVLARSNTLKPRTARADNYSEFSIGRWEFTIAAHFVAREGRIGVNLAIKGPNNKVYFHTLHAQQQTLEQAIGSPLSWWELPDAKSSYISLYRYNTVFEDEEAWPEQHLWLLEKLELFYSTFVPLVLPMGRE